MTDWRIYYSDGGTFSHEDGDPLSAPPHGVVCISQFANGKKTIMHGWDWYYWNAEHGEWWGIDDNGITDRLMHGLCIEALKQGRTVPTPLYQEMMTLADKDFR